jgi:hypothetical protein
MSNDARFGLACLVSAAIAASGCFAMKPSNTPNTALAMDFARALAAGEYPKAHGLLSASLQAEMPPEKLGAAYAGMVSYGEGAPTIVEVMTTLDDWPDKHLGDTEWVYVAIANDTYSEAVSVVVTQEASRLAIRAIEWGRP